MTAKEYFGDWMKVIDKTELLNIMRWLSSIDKSKLCPAYPNIFKAFKLCPFKDCKVIFLGMDPYSQPGVATGILFGNSKDTPEEQLSPSLQVVKESVINYEIPHNLIEFDNTLESWAKQGILMINSALTCHVNAVGSHVETWKPFMAKLIHNISLRDNGLVFVLFGAQARFYKKYIAGTQCIIEVKHPAYFARTGEIMPYSVFTDINKFLKQQYNEQIEFYKEEKYQE